MNQLEIQFICENADLKTAAEEVCLDLGICVTENASVKVSVSKGDFLSVSGDEKNVHLTYHKKNELFRALSFLPEYLREGKEIREHSPSGMLCYMADNSRNAVFNINAAKRIIRRLAVMGYDSVMLYTEDTYEVPEYPYFGYMRGRFTETELKQLDDYCDLFGLELIPCIQALAHLATALRWEAFGDMRDTENVLLVGEEKTYSFLRAAIGQCRRCFRSKRVNIGMDEAFLLGKGEYFKRNGYRPTAEIMREHLQKVTDICVESGFSPMMWSDMFFRMCFQGHYHVRTERLPDGIPNTVPENLTLIYWDYYTDDRELFANMLRCHKQFKNPVAFAGGAWKWTGFAPHNRHSIELAKMQLDECAKIGVDNLIVTAWGDNGGEASQFSVLSTLLYWAESCYHTAPTVEWLNHRSMACFDLNFDDMLALDLPNDFPGTLADQTHSPKNPCKYLLYNDPFERLMDRHLKPDTAERYREKAEYLAKFAEHSEFGYIFRTLSFLCSVLELKSDLGVRLHNSYCNGNKEILSQIANAEIPEILHRIDSFEEVFREQWYSENKPHGFCAQELRLGGLKERLKSVQKRLICYLNGEIPEIEELKDEALPFIQDEDRDYMLCNRWHLSASANII